ncbi:MAG: hypothetical protein H7A39_07185 [Chlamydiales bacterium]|nr:hypothetical protein [Chlamydiales bacterium]
MLAVLRKYQKFFIAIVSVFLVFSFLFFGLFGALQKMPSRRADKVIGKAIDGSDLKLQSSENLVRFISSDYLDNHLIQRRQMPNLFNDGVIRKDFIQTGLGALIAERYFDEIEGDLKKRFEQAKKFTPYEHPQGKFLSMAAIWAQFAPQLKSRVEKVQAMEFGPGVFEALARTYVDQGGLNAEAVRRMLYSQQSQFQWMQQDPFLVHGDLGLFGAHSLEDWFGRRFLEISAQLVHNGAIVAKQRNYKVGYQEAKANLMQNGYEYLCAQKRGQVVGASDVADMFTKQLQHLQMSEGEAVEAWREVMLFRRLFDEVGGSVYADPLLQKQFDSYAHAGRNVCAYRLSETVRKEPYLAMLYAELVGKPCAGLPLEAKEISNIPKELLEERFLVEVASVDKFDLVGRVSVKEMLQFELDGKNWEQLKSKFKDLKKAETRDERLAALDSLAPAVRDQLDASVREQIVGLHPEWIEEALSKAQPSEEVLHVALAGTREPLEGITQLDAFRTLLKEESDHLNCFTDDQKHFYRIKVSKQCAEPEILSFQEALESGVLEKLMNKRIEKQYVKVRELDPQTYQDEKGQWKAWHEVKADVAKACFEQVFAQRSKAHLEMVRQKLVAGESVALAGFGQQWELEKVSGCVKRAEPHWFLSDDFSRKDVGTWSEVVISKQGDFLFGYIESDAASKTPTAYSVRSAQELLSREAKRAMLQGLLEKIDIAPHV